MSAGERGAPSLVRGIGLRQAVALNVNNMIGIGPFITIPLIVSDMGGPQALLCWVLGGGIALCEELAWAELSGRLPGSGGTHIYLRESYGPRWGRLMSFQFVWQVAFQGPLSFAGGAIGLPTIWPISSPISRRGRCAFSRWPSRCSLR